VYIAVYVIARCNSRRKIYFAEYSQQSRSFHYSHWIFLWLILKSWLFNPVLIYDCLVICETRTTSKPKNIQTKRQWLKCTKDQSSHFCDCFLVSKWIFQHYDHCLTKFHEGFQESLMCVVINNSSYPTVKTNNTAYHAYTAYHAFGKYWMQARGFLYYRLKYFWPKVIFWIYLGS